MDIAGVPYDNPISYKGPKINLMPIMMFFREPRSTDTKYPVGTMCIIGPNSISGVKGNLWYLSGFDSNSQALWVRIVSTNNNNDLFPWTMVTSSSHNLEVNNGYFANHPLFVQFFLPLISVVGDTIIITNVNNGFLINQNAGQKIFSGNKSTTLGVGGYVAAASDGDSITLVCSQDNTNFVVTSSLQGNITFT